MRKAVRCTVGERILLHLLNFKWEPDQWDVPFETTQDGIAQCVGVMRTAVAREISRMRPDGIVEEDTKHIKGEKRKRKAYYLSTKGIEIADEIDTRIRDSKVLIEYEKGFKNVVIDSLNGHLGLDLTPAEHMRFVSTNSVYREKEAQEYAVGKHGPKEEGPVELKMEGSSKDLRSVDYTDKLPSIRNFFGREQELKKIDGFLTDSKCKFVVIQGLAGMGKTTLAAKVVDIYRDKYNIFWYTFGNWNNLRNIMIPFSVFMKKLNKPRLAAYLRTGEDFEYERFFELLQQDAQGMSVILVFDNYHRADDKSKLFMGALVDALEWVKGSTLFVLSRDVPKFYNRAHVKVKGSVQEIFLEGLDLSSSRNLLRLDDVDDELMESIHNITQGHPLALELLDSVGSLDSIGDVHNFIEEEIIREITPEQSFLLSIASVFRYPVEPKAFFIGQEVPDLQKTYGKDPVLENIQKINYDTISALVKKTLLKEYSDRSIDVHDFVREFFYSRLTPLQQKCFHGLAARYYSSKNDSASSVEVMHHLIKAGELGEAAQVALEEGPGLLYNGYVEFVNILEEMPTDRLDEKTAEGITALKSDAAARLGGVGLMDEGLT